MMRAARVARMTGYQVRRWVGGAGVAGPGGSRSTAVMLVAALEVLWGKAWLGVTGVGQVACGLLSREEAVLVFEVFVEAVVEVCFGVLLGACSTSLAWFLGDVAFNTKSIMSQETRKMDVQNTAPVATAELQVSISRLRRC